MALTLAQIAKASVNAQIAYCLDKQPTYDAALAEEIEALVTAPLLARIADLTNAIDQEMIVSHLGVFNDGDDPAAAIKKLMLWSQGVGEYFEGEKYKERIAALTAQVEQDSAPEKADPRKLQLQGLILAAVRLGLAQPSEALMHQLDRLIEFYKGDKFADALRLLRHSVRNPKVSRRIPLLPSAAAAVSAQHLGMVEQAAQPVAWRYKAVAIVDGERVPVKKVDPHRCEFEITQAEPHDWSHLSYPLDYPKYEDHEPLYTAPPKAVPLTDEQIEAAAKVLSHCMDYPWEHMPESGRLNMRKNARTVIEAAIGTPATVEKGGE